MKSSSKLAFTLLGGLLAFIILGGLFVTLRRAELSARLEKIRLAGDPASIKDLVPEEIESGEYAADQLAGIADRMAKIYQSHYEALDTSEFNWQTGVSEQMLRELTAQFDQNTDLTDAYQRAAHSDYLGWPSRGQNPERLNAQQFMNAQQFNEDLLANLNDARAVARFNRIRTRFLVAQGKYDEAATACLDQLHLCRLQDATPTLVAFLVNIACRRTALEDLNGILQSAKLSQESHAAIEQELSMHDSMDRFADALKTERALGIDLFRSMPRTVSREIIVYLDLMEDQIANAKLPSYRAGGIKPGPTSGLAALVVPAIQEAQNANSRNLIFVRCVRILNAIQRNPEYEGSDHQGSDLVAVNSLGLPAEATTDPYADGKLIVEPRNGQWIIYSVGQNQADDGGSVADQSDIGIAPVLVGE